MARNRTFIIALVASTMLHLSMVTLFSIVVRFPRKDADYFFFEIVQMPAAARETAPVAVSEGLLGDAAALDVTGGADTWEGFPHIELPTLEFAELKRLRFREESLRVGERYERLFRDTPRDPWARFGFGLREFGEAIARLGPPWGEQEEDGQPRRQPAGRHGAGFAFYIEWMGDPGTRQPIVAPPIDVLWEADADTLALPIEMIFNVSPEGKVIEVQTPLPDDAGVINGIGRALRNYRFEALPEGETDNQRGVFIVMETQEGP
ncbi:MAG TPA: hypothetical protein HPP77_10285 [Candidatus Hydrogenedentes bacterium]|nr:hypothetical protein [Candidatus Hydrogenedentota bacterium]HIJ74336.1 hypothetical protein [Candidatus Hydrogenedentota bacterium]